MTDRPGHWTPPPEFTLFGSPMADAIAFAAFVVAWALFATQHG